MPANRSMCSALRAKRRPTAATASPRPQVRGGRRPGPVAAPRRPRLRILATAAAHSSATAPSSAPVGRRRADGQGGGLLVALLCLTQPAAGEQPGRRTPPPADTAPARDPGSPAIQPSAAWRGGPGQLSYADHEQAWTAHSSAGPLEKVIEIAGADAVRQVMHDVLEADRKADGQLARTTFSATCWPSGRRGLVPHEAAEAGQDLLQAGLGRVDHAEEAREAVDQAGAGHVLDRDPGVLEPGGVGRALVP